MVHIVDETPASDARVEARPATGPTSFSLGGFGPTLKEQGMEILLCKADVKHFDLDDAAISRLFQRGLISYSVHVKAREKLAAKIRAAIDARPAFTTLISDGAAKRQDDTDMSATV